MSVLRGHILERSTELFNMKGFFNVSIQEIAKDLDISPGNFTYHFPKKEDLLLAIQQEIIAKASLNIFPSETVPAFTHLEELFEQFFEIQKRYSFFFSNLQYLSYEYPEVIQPYKEVSKQRLEDARKLVDYYILTNRFIPESERVNYDTLIHNLWTLNTFWKLKSELIGGENDFQTSIAHIWNTILPFLTDKGFDEYSEIQSFKKRLKNN